MRDREAAAAAHDRHARIALEQTVAHIHGDERVEVAPRSIRLRKRHLDPHERKRASRKAEGAWGQSLSRVDGF